MGRIMRKRLTRQGWKRRKQLRRLIILGAISIVSITVLCILSVLLGSSVLKNSSTYTIGKNVQLQGNYPTDLNLNVQLLTPNPFSRPEDKLEKVKGVVIHYTANPKTDSIANRNYFENLKTTQTTKASSHFVIGLKGDIVQCIPTREIAYASNERNIDTISIEVCHPDETGEFSKESYDTLVHLVAWLVCEYDLDSDQILRHYDVTGKICPKYFVDHQDKWNEFLKDVYQFIERNQT